MTHKIQAVKAKDNYHIEAIFYNGKTVLYDMKPLFEIFKPFKIFLQNPSLFTQVKVDQGGYGISWNDDLDLDAKTIWNHGILIESTKQTSINHIVAYHLLLARERANLTQKELAERTGIYQAEISKLERGLGNPSISTLNRLADGLGMELQVDFVLKNDI